MQREDCFTSVTAEISIFNFYNQKALFSIAFFYEFLVLLVGVPGSMSFPQMNRFRSHELGAFGFLFSVLLLSIT